MTIRKRIIFISLFVFAIILISFTLKYHLHTSTSLWKTYTDDKYQISLNYPPELYIDIKNESGVMFKQIHPKVVKLPHDTRIGWWVIHSLYISFGFVMERNPNMSLEEQINYKPENMTYYGIPIEYEKSTKYNKNTYQFKAKSPKANEVIDTLIVIDNKIYSLWFESPGITPEWEEKYDKMINSVSASSSL